MQLILKLFLKYLPLLILVKTGLAVFDKYTAFEDAVTASKDQVPALNRRIVKAEKELKAAKEFRKDLLKDTHQHLAQ